MLNMLNNVNQFKQMLVSFIEKPDKLKLKMQARFYCSIIKIQYENKKLRRMTLDYLYQ